MKHCLFIFIIAYTCTFSLPLALQAQEVHTPVLPKLIKGLRKEKEETSQAYLERVQDYPYKSLILWLDLSDCNLRQIPDFVKEFGRLKSLNLSGNSIEEIPSWLNHLPHLKRLSLQRNGLAERRLKIRRNSTIVELNLSRNELRKLPLNFTV